MPSRRPRAHDLDRPVASRIGLPATVLERPAIARRLASVNAVTILMGGVPISSRPMAWPVGG